MADETPKKTGGKAVLIIVLVAVIVVLIGLVIVLALNSNNSKPQEPDNNNSTQEAEEGTEEKREVLVTEENAVEVINEIGNQEYVEPGYYTATQSNVWHFSSGDAASADSYVSNVAENTNDIYFDIFLQDNEDDPIYQSPILPRGTEIKGIKLDKKLDAGTYDCILVYHLVDDDQNTISTVTFTVQIIIEH